MQQHEKEDKQRKQEEIDPLKQEETVRKIAVETKRQQIINDGELSLKQRQFDRIAIENARSDMEANIRQKEIRDTKKIREEKAISQVIM